MELFGVGEPVVQVQSGTFGASDDHRLSVELPGITDVKDAIAMIGQTPFLEFRTQSDGPQQVTVGPDGTASLDPMGNFVPTKLTGKYLKQAQLTFAPTTGEPVISLQFNDEGAKLLKKLQKLTLEKL